MSSSKSRTGKLTYADYERIPDDGKRHEIVGWGSLREPAPDITTRRSRSVSSNQLYSQIELTGLGVVFDAPTDLVLSPSDPVDIVQPDLLVVLESRRSIIERENNPGRPTTSSSRSSRCRRAGSTSARSASSTSDGACRSTGWSTARPASCSSFCSRRGATADAVKCADRIVFRGVEGVRIDLDRVWS
jgi:hypothetical protein